MTTQTSGANTFFRGVTAWPKTFLLLSLIAIVSLASLMPGLQKDTSSDAFIADDDPVLIYRDHVRDVFGLEDPVAVAIVNDGENGIYNPGSLNLVDYLTREISRISNVDPDRITSLATESNIVGTDEGMEVTDFFEPFPATQADAEAIRQAIEGFPLYQGSLVARDGKATLIVVELLDQALAQETYDTIMTLVAEAPLSPGDEVHVAGEGAISGYMATYIDNDAKRLNPLAAVVITIVLFVAFRTIGGTLLPNVIVLGTLTATFGLMAAMDVSFYVITNGLASILIGIAVADSIHVLSQYYEEAAREPGLAESKEGRRELSVRAMTRMWKPITLTTLTTVAGFLGLWLGASMPPMQYFGLFAAIGVAAAWVYSIFFLPAALAVFRLRPSKLFRSSNTNDRYGAVLKALGGVALKRPGVTLCVAAVVAIIGVAGTSRVIVQEAQIENFQREEPIYIADMAINDRMDGTYFLDVVIETGEPEALFRPDHLKRIEALQDYIESFPEVQGSTSVVDYIKQMHKSVNENRDEFYTIPDDEFLIAQLFLLYSASGEPDDFEEEIDTDYSQANVRFNLPAADYRLLTRIVPEFQDYVTNEFNTEDIRATLSGRVMVNHTWLETVGDNHVKSLLLSLLFVWIAATLVFRSILGGTLSLVPVIMALLLVYAVMGYGGIWLGVGTSMFAAIAIGLGIDFAIHTIDRMKELIMTRQGSLDERLADLFPSTGRALFFNFAALALGFAVLTTSEVPPLIKFGILVGVAVSTAFTASMLILPAIAKLLRPAFLFPESERAPGSLRASRIATATSSFALAALATVLISDFAFAQGPDGAENLPAANDIIAAVNDRDDGLQVTRSLKMELIDRRGKSRVRDTIGYRKYFGEEKRTVLFYRAPTNVKGTGFLTYDYPDAEVDDDQWLYLPALRKVRRISAADRGDYFLGTDFTYEDIKKESKIAIEDYTVKTVGSEEVDGSKTWLVEGIPVDQETAEELGYGRVLWRIDPAIGMSRMTELWDVNGNPLKIIRNEQIEKIQGIWTTMKLTAVNHKTGHSTIFTFGDVDYETEIDASTFEQRTLRRGQ